MVTGAYQTFLMYQLIFALDGRGFHALRRFYGWKFGTYRHFPGADRGDPLQRHRHHTRTVPHRLDTETTSAVISLDQLPSQAGTYTWRVVPYWTTGTERYQWQQICLLRTGGTFDKPETDSSVPNAFR